MKHKKPKWVDGQPDNLEAAARDAMEWLAWFSNTTVCRNAGTRRRLDACLSALEKFLEKAE